MEKIIECLSKIDHEYKIRTENIKNKISKISKSLLEPIDEKYFLKNFIELKKYAKIIDDIDVKFYDKLKILHDSWMEDYNKIYSFCISSKSKGLIFKKKLSSYDYDKVKAYCDDLEITTNSIKKITKWMNTKISSLQIQEFLRTKNTPYT
jgi:hypothetical protein